jgi:hypothetical protein
MPPTICIPESAENVNFIPDEKPIGSGIERQKRSLRKGKENGRYIMCI